MSLQRGRVDQGGARLAEGVTTGISRWTTPFGTGTPSDLILMEVLKAVLAGPRGGARRASRAWLRQGPPRPPLAHHGKITGLGMSAHPKTDAPFRDGEAAFAALQQAIAQVAMKRGWVVMPPW